MQDDAERVSGFIHYKHPKAATAACGFSGGIICHPSWDKVSCPDCLEKRRRFSKQKLYVIAFLALVVMVIIIFMAAVNPF